MIENFNKEFYLSLDLGSKKTYLIEFTKNLVESGKNLTLELLEKQGITYDYIVGAFKNLTALKKIHGISPKKRPNNLKDEELKIYLIKISNVDLISGCWTTDTVTIDPIKNISLFSYKRKTMPIYRVAYKLFKGEIDPKLFVLHNCDNSRCYNPDHLRKGTAKENVDDCVKRKRHKTGKSKFKKHGLKNPYNYNELLFKLKR